MSIDARVMSQLEDFYEEALEMGMTEEKARDWAWDKHMDWAEEKKAMNEIDILKKNVADLQRQYQETLIKIKKLQEEK